jgi:two-component system sensor histidine kinase DegS
VALVLEERGLNEPLSAEDEAKLWLQERFATRARALFYARMMFLTLGLCILGVPIWRNYFGFGPLAFGGYFFMLLYSVANYLVLGQEPVDRFFTYVTLCLDLVVMIIVVSKPHEAGGLANPLLATQLLFTTLFALLFPKPLAVLPPLLALPITARLDQLLDRNPTAVEVLTLMWYLGLNFIIIYVLVYLNERELAAHREVVQLESELKDLAVVEERNRLAREIHDGLGANLSSLIIQSEYVVQIAHDEAVKREVRELKQTAEEAIEELRRSLHMMREDFDLGFGLEDYVKTFGERTQLDVAFTKSGTLQRRLPPETSLALFRVLQELLSNAAKHAQNSRVEVKLDFGPERISLGVKDAGPGFDPTASKPGHYGLTNLKERAIKVGAEVTVDAKLGHGAHIVFSVPVSERERPNVWSPP